MVFETEQDVTTGVISKARAELHRNLMDRIVRLRKDKKSGLDFPNFADGGCVPSRELAEGVVERLGYAMGTGELKGQTAGTRFEAEISSFIQQTFGRLRHLRPGEWRYGVEYIDKFEQYEHLDEVQRIAEHSPELKALLGSDYIIKPDIVISRMPEADSTINAGECFVDEQTARASSLRMSNNTKPLLHASISCKWTIRSDRSQNSRSEGLNLIRNRKGRLPHVVVVTAEPLPSRIASIALGTGDIDCTYHVALYELTAAAENSRHEDAAEMLRMMVASRRLRDISDLPLDLAV